MSDVIWAALISALGAIIVALITQYYQSNKENKDGKVDNPGKKGWKIKSTVTLYAILIVGVLIFLLIKVANSENPSATAENATPQIALSETKVEFRVTVKDSQIIIPAGGTINTLQQGDSITIESIVTDQNGSSYPGELAFLYYFASGGSFSGKVAPYLARQSDTITVKIEDQVTHEVILRTMLVHIK